MRLTPRELDTLCCLMNGLCTKAIAAEMGISLETARCHLKALYRKLQIDSSRQLLRPEKYAEARGLLGGNDKSNVDSSLGERDTASELRTHPTI